MKKKHDDIAVGTVFGHVTVTGHTKLHYKDRSVRAVTCVCDCGNNFTAIDSNVRRGLTKSCGCMNIGKRKNIPPGTVFGRLTVVSSVDFDITKKRSFSNCRCECGFEGQFENQNLNSGRQKSCGCLQTEHRKNIGKTTLTHGHSKREERTHEYACWAAMKSRCLCETNHKFHCYGAVGITVCERWNDFSLFIQDMGESPSKKHTLDRYPNRSGNYEPGNVRWATPREQVLNRDATVWITVDGETKCVSDWLAITGTSRSTYYSRIRKGFSPERSIEKRSIRNP